MRLVGSQPVAACRGRPVSVDFKRCLSGSRSGNDLTGLGKQVEVNSKRATLMRSVLLGHKGFEELEGEEKKGRKSRRKLSKVCILGDKPVDKLTTLRPLIYHQEAHLTLGRQTTCRGSSIKRDPN